MKGVYFTLDAIFGTIIIVTAIVLLLTLQQPQESTNYIQLTSKDVLASLNTLTLGELTSAQAAEVRALNISSDNDTVLYVLGVLWATNNSLAQNFTQSIFADFSSRYSYAVFAESDLLYENSTKLQSSASRVSSSKQQISGIAPGKPLSGSTATAFLKKVENKTTSSYVYFGGFVGQGNLSFFLVDLPADISASTIRDVTLELDTPAPFTLYINGSNCGYYTPVIVGNASVNRWSVSGCNDKFQAGNTPISFTFNSSVDESYIAGGYLAVRYVTQFETVDPYATPQTVLLPGIEGVVNLYDAFFVPGNITSMKIYLHYLADHSGALASNSFYITIANKTVYRENFSNTTQTVTLTDLNLSALNYSALSQQTIPIRIGFENLSFATLYTGNANVLLVTDVSGSMGDEMGSNSNGQTRNCTDALINASTTNRISVAKCLDKQFSQDILNISGNLLGLVSYQTSTVGSQTIPLTTNLTLINNTINLYSPGTSTCICCGINSAVAELNKSILRTFYVNKGASWKYLFLGNATAPPSDDPSGNSWYNITYSNESTWSSGNAVLGSNENGSGPAIVTNIGNSLLATQVLPNLWDMALDGASPEIDFTSGMNSTANTYGIAGADDGWDWQGGAYQIGNSSSVNFRGAVSGWLRMDFNTSPSNRNNCPNQDCSGSYGIKFNITPAMWTMLQNNGVARLSLSYDWTSTSANTFENSDQVWIKLRFSSNTTTTYLGSELDNSGTDNTVEIAAGDNPDSEFSGAFSQTITNFITGPGTYYLDFGAKLMASNDDEWGYARFDNIFLAINNQTDSYYLRKSFNITDTNNAQTLILNVLSDDRATVYFNGIQLFDEPLAHSSEYWNVHGFIIPQDYIIVGTNQLAVRLENIEASTKFDAELFGLNTSKNLAMLAMTDGQANQECSQQNTGDAKRDAVLAACQARENWGITVHAVGFSTDADNETLFQAATCAGGLYASSANSSELTDFYKNVALNILEGSIKSQSIILNSSYQQSILYNDSYIWFNHTPAYPSLRTNEITVRTQTPQFNTCSPNIYLNPTARILAAELTSYSAEHWTDLVTANGNTVYNLSSYNTSYIVLGDPYIVHIPPSMIAPGNNIITMRTGDSFTNSTGCSENNSLITTLGIQLSTAYTPVVESVVGCTWTVEHDDATFQVIPVPRDYTGGNTCSYTNAGIAYNTNDAYDVAVFGLLQSLDYDGDGRIFLSLSDEDLEVIVTKISSVPYLWGPSIIEVRAWQ